MILEIILDFLKGLLQDWLKPFLGRLWAWFLRLKLYQRIVLGSLIALILCISYWHADFFEYTSCIFRVLRSPDHILLTSKEKTKLNEVISEANNDLVNVEFAKRGSQEVNAWTTSQIIVASKTEDAKSKKADYLNYIETTDCRVNSCCCWSEFPDSVGHLVVTAWVILGHVKCNQPINNTLIEYILDQRNSEGWWPLFPIGNNEQNASTLTTAFLAFALGKALERNLIPLNKVSAAKQAVTAALQWLVSNNIGKDRPAVDYPNFEGKKELICLTAFLVHVIHELEGNKESSNFVYFDWAENIQQTIDRLHRWHLHAKDVQAFDITSQDKSGYTIKADKPYRDKHDEVDCYNLPWSIIASCDAFKYANFWDKVLMVKFADDIVEQSPQLVRDCGTTQPWLKSEFLISLRYLNNEDVLKP